jgi:hypothetical protein
LSCPLTSPSRSEIRCLKKRGRLVVRKVPALPALLDELARAHPLDRSGARLWP